MRQNMDGIVEGLPFLLGHVLRIELGTGRLLTKTFHKRLVAVQSIPRTIGDAGETSHIGIANS